MILYNVTVKVNASIAEAWLSWLQSEHIPDVMNTGCFTRYLLLQLLDIDDSEGPTFAIQYFAESKAELNKYFDNFAPEMRSRGTYRWGDKFIAFRSVMKVIN